MLPGFFFITGLATRRCLVPLLAFLVVALELVEALLSLEILRRTGRGKDFVAGYLDGSVGWFLWCLEDLEAKRIFFWRLEHLLL